jgi:integrase
VPVATGDRGDSSSIDSAAEALRTDPPRAAIEPNVGAPLTEAEASYVEASRAENTRRGYTADWREWVTWAAENGYAALPAQPEAISRYLTELARHGAKIGTMSRRRSAIRHAHRMAGYPDPSDHARVDAVWEGIRRTHGEPPEQARALAPPELWAVLEACPPERQWRDPHRPAEVDVAGARDRALLLVGFVGALRRSELVGLDLDDVLEHPLGRVLVIRRSKTNQLGTTPDLVVLPRVARAAHCPVRALDAWLEHVGETTGPLFRPVSRGNRPLARRLDPGAANVLVKRAIERAGYVATDYSAHSLRAGFVTYAHRLGIADRAIARQTRHRSLASVGIYIRLDDAWEDNAATLLQLIG